MMRPKGSRRRWTDGNYVLGFEEIDQTQSRSLAVRRSPRELAIEAPVYGCFCVTTDAFGGS